MNFKKTDSFKSAFRKVGDLVLPPYSGTRIMMMPLILGDVKSVPDFLRQWHETIVQLAVLGAHPGEIGYLTIDEKPVKAEETHRRAGAHVDGVLNGSAGGWGGGGGGGWGSAGNGMLTVANIVGCKAWNQEFNGRIGNDGECDHLMDQAKEENATEFAANSVYWVDGLCVHESMPMKADVNRQFVRLSLPSCAPWFKEYTENPLGVLPTGPILERRSFMDM